MNYVRIATNECKGCKLCVHNCPNDCLGIGSEINRLGYQAAVFKNPNCTACGICYYVCPEPGAITVFKNEDLPEKEVVGA